MVLVKRREADFGHILRAASSGFNRKQETSEQQPKVETERQLNVELLPNERQLSTLVAASASRQFSELAYGAFFASSPRALSARKRCRSSTSTLSWLDGSHRPPGTRYGCNPRESRMPARPSSSLLDYGRLEYE